MKRHCVFQGLGLLALVVGNLCAAAETGSYSVKLYPYDAPLAEQMNQGLSDAGVTVAENPQKSDGYLGTLRWDVSAKTAFTRPGEEMAKDYETNANAYDSKPHRVKKIQQEEAKKKPAEKKPNLFSKIFGGGSSSGETDAKPAGTAASKPAEKAKSEPSALGRLFGDRDEHVTESGRYRSSADPYATKHRRAGEKEVTEPERAETANAETTEPEATASEQEAAAVDTAVQETAVSEAEEPAVTESAPVETADVKEEPAAEPEQPEVKAAEATREKKGFFGAVSDTVTKPFKGLGSGEKAYTATATMVLPTGRKVILPAVKSRDKAELDQMLTRLSTQCIQWIKDGKPNLIPALNTAAAVRNPKDLERRIERAEKDPNWLKGGGYDEKPR